MTTPFARCAAVVLHAAVACQDQLEGCAWLLDEPAERLVGSSRFVDLARPLLDCGHVRLPLVVQAVPALSPVLGPICTTDLHTLLERRSGSSRIQ